MRRPVNCQPELKAQDLYLGLVLLAKHAQIAPSSDRPPVKPHADCARTVCHMGGCPWCSSRVLLQCGDRVESGAGYFGPLPTLRWPTA